MRVGREGGCEWGGREGEGGEGGRIVCEKCLLFPPSECMSRSVAYEEVFCTM